MGSVGNIEVTVTIVYMTILLENFVPFSMQNSRGTQNTNERLCVKRTEENSHAESYFDMKFESSSDENDIATTSSLPSTSHILAPNTLANAGINKPSCSSANNNGNNNNNSSSSNSKGMSKKVGKRPGRKPAKIDERAKLERSRQSAKECRARKKLRYQYLEELVLNREKAVLALKDELESFKQWCTHLDAGGKIPDALLKMIANEDISRQANQMESFKRAAHLRQQHHQQPLGQSTGAAISSSFAAAHHSLPQTSPDRFTPCEVSPSRLPNLSPTQPERHYKAPALKRQLAFDCGNTVSYSNPSHQQRIINQYKQQQQQQQSCISSTGYNPTNTATVSKLSFVASQLAPPASSYAERMHEPQSSKSDGLSYNTSVSSSQRPLLSDQQRPPPQQRQLNSMPPQQNESEGKFSFFPRHTPPVSRIKSEPPMKHIQPPQYCSPIQEDALVESRYPSALSLPGLNVPRSGPAPTTLTRGRSHSNPANMTRMSQLPVSPTEGGRRVDELVSSFRERDARELDLARFHKPKAYSLPNALIPATLSEEFKPSPSNLGLFSGQPVPLVSSVSSLTSSEISSATTMEDVNSCSSDENAAELPLFQSSYTFPQKRTLSDPVIHIQSMEVPMSDSNIIDNDMSVMHDCNYQELNVDPITTLNNLTTVHCFSSTRTLNTPSPSPFGVVPRNTDSPFSCSPAPSSSMGYPNTTPSSSNTPSPAPLLSFSSLAELSSTTGVAEEEFAMDCVSTASHYATPTMATTVAPAVNPTPSSVVCSDTGLSATISEPIPDWYSYLLDLEEGGFIPKQPEPERTVTPVNKFLNVPNFLDEILGDDKDD